jgi:branched-chain amino acid transport system ATP-binding protein
VLEIRGLDVAIAGVQVLHGVELAVPGGSVAALIGHNGAGKTTLMRTIMGLIPAGAGTIRFEGQDLRALPAHTRVGLGIGYMPEDRRLVPELTVEENVLLPVWASGQKGAAERLEWIYGIIHEVAEQRARRATQLSGGQQKLVALARALLAGRRLLLLDEPFEGVAPVLARRLAEVVARLKEEGLSVLLSESDYTHSVDLLDHLFVIERGVVEARPAREGLHGDRPAPGPGAAPVAPGLSRRP